MNDLALVADFDAPVNTVAIRLADEGVPVRAIARCLKMPCEEVYEVLKEARMSGTLIELPKDDWPVGAPRAQRSTLAGTPLANDDDLALAFARCFTVTRLESLVLALMMKRNDVTKEQIHIVIEQNRLRSDQPETDIKMVDVVICHIRRKLKKHGIAIETIWATGYRFSTVERAKVMSALLAFVAGGS